MHLYIIQNSVSSHVDAGIFILIAQMLRTIESIWLLKLENINKASKIYVLISVMFSEQLSYLKWIVSSMLVMVFDDMLNAIKKDITIFLEREKGISK